MGKRYEFGEFILDTQEGWLSRRNEPVKATPRQLALLEALVEKRGRLVEKKEILERVWAGTAVSEANLTVQMSKLRRLLGETEEAPFIETVPTRGYRFLLPVHILPPAATAALPLRRPVPVPEPEPDSDPEGEPVAPPVPAESPIVAAPVPHAKVDTTGHTLPRWVLGALGLAALALIAWLATRGAAPEPPAPADTSSVPTAPNGERGGAAPDGRVRLTSSTADDWEPALSADGRTVAFVSNRDGAPSIYLLPLDRRGEAPIPVPTKGPATAPAWSPDGARLAYVCQRNGQADVCLVGRDGSGERVVAAEPQDELDPVWSPDGRQLAYTIVSGRTWELRVIDVDVAGAEPRPTGPAGWSTRTPAWSPDGRRLAVARSRTAENYDIWIVPLDGAPPTAVVESDESKVDPAWSPDGRRLAYATGRGLVVVDVETGATTPVPATDRRDRRPTWTADGRSLVIERRDGNAEIYVVPVPPAVAMPGPAPR